jgi:hypothetical protein
MQKAPEEAPMKNERSGKTNQGGDTQPVPVTPSYQEGSVESVGGGPAGTDESDRSGDGTLPTAGTRLEEPVRDAFISSEVTDKTSVPGKDPRTRS